MASCRAQGQGLRAAAGQHSDAVSLLHSWPAHQPQAVGLVLIWPGAAHMQHPSLSVLAPLPLPHSLCPTHFAPLTLRKALLCCCTRLSVASAPRPSLSASYSRGSTNASSAAYCCCRLLRGRADQSDICWALSAYCKGAHRHTHAQMFHCAATIQHAHPRACHCQQGGGCCLCESQSDKAAQSASPSGFPSKTEHSVDSPTDDSARAEPPCGTTGPPVTSRIQDMLLTLQRVIV